MTPLSIYNTKELLGTDYDAIHVIYQNIFRLLKPVRRKYKISINNLIVLNGCYLYHKNKGSLLSVYTMYKYIGYYNRNKLKWHIGDLIKKGCLIDSDLVKNIQYYKITELGIQVMKDFNDSYQAILYKWYNDNGITP